MLLHLTRVEDVMCFKHLSFLFLVHQEQLAVNAGEKWNLLSSIVNIEKSRQYYYSLYIKWDKWKWVLSFVAKWHFQILLIRTYKDMFMTFSMEVSDVKISWNAKSKQYFHFKLQQGDGETRVIFLCQGKLEKIKQKERNRLPAHVTNVGIPMVNIDWTSCLECPQWRVSRSIAALSLIGFKTMNMIGRKTSLREHPVFLSLGFFVHETSAEKSRCRRTVKKNTSDSIEPRVYELGTIQLEVRYFWTSNRISPGLLVSHPLVKGNKDSWYEIASIPVETTHQSVRKNNLWYHWRFQSYLILSA